MSENERSSLLQFVTSCPRAPLLGFKSLYPKFTIQRVNLHKGEMRLPTSSTCVNLLKLPAYDSKEKMKEKIYQALPSHTGFQMS